MTYTSSFNKAMNLTKAGLLNTWNFKLNKITGIIPFPYVVQALVYLPILLHTLARYKFICFLEKVFSRKINLRNPFLMNGGRSSLPSSSLINFEELEVELSTFSANSTAPSFPWTIFFADILVGCVGWFPVFGKLGQKFLFNHVTSIDSKTNDLIRKVGKGMWVVGAFPFIIKSW